VNLVSVCGKFSGLYSVHGAYFVVAKYLFLLSVIVNCLNQHSIGHFHSDS